MGLSRESIADAIREHEWDITVNSPHCVCGELAYSITEHRADVVWALIEAETREEWGTRYPGVEGNADRHVSEDSARWRASEPETFGPLEVVSRRVGDWRKS